MTRREQLGLGRCGLWEKLLSAEDGDWVDVLRSDQSLPEDWRTLARRGGFPTPAVHMKAPAERAVWFEGYVRTYLERDLQTLSAISALPDFRRLMRAAGLRLGQLINQTELARRRPTPADGVPLLKPARNLLFANPRVAIFRESQQAPHQNSQTLLGGCRIGSSFGRASRTNGRAPRKYRAARPPVLERYTHRTGGILYWRTTTGEEVDFVIEAGRRFLPIEIKATSRPRLADITSLRSFRAEYGKASRSGLLLHTGESFHWLTPDVLAAPWWSVC